MILVRKISPSEFRLPHKAFILDYGPVNYYEKLKIELFLKRIIYAYATQEGVYLFIQAFKPISKMFLLQFYFYRTEGIQYMMDMRQYHDPVLATKRIKHYGKLSRVKNTEGVPWAFSILLKKYFFKSFKYVKAKKHLIMFNAPIVELHFHFFFNVVFLYYFSKMVVVLAKSLYRLLLQNETYTDSFEDALYNNRYLLGPAWTFDLLVAFHYTFIFSDTCFLFPLLVRHLLRRKKHTHLILDFVRLMHYFYLTKSFIDGVCLFLKGTYNKHSRTKNEVYDYGKMSLVNPNSPLIYDAINCPTYYGSIQLKFWLYFVAVKSSSNFDETI
jgi:hypothetical protein